ncbi:hypothetical protein SDC9_154699 [bioreactor metagenome]|uniref:Uncharacterized protein n=1 Tax=bioreactor metagenome TaxID=1076179 RepID=A0A645F1X6_9ZZZZ
MVVPPKQKGYFRIVHFQAGNLHGAARLLYVLVAEGQAKAGSPLLGGIEGVPALAQPFSGHANAFVSHGNNRHVLPRGRTKQQREWAAFRLQADPLVHRFNAVHQQV